ncbi:MAG: hypothetical protein L3J39_18175 [Verrucomicrobiales bacterium]|nr:hypothetical protein [Verrucomicrobiales bacterium]
MTKNQLNSFSLHDLSNYLRSERWEYKGQYPDKAYVFEKNDKSVLVPMSKHFQDYYLRLSEAVREISVLEERGTRKVIADLQSAGADTLRIRVNGPEVAHGLISIEKGALLFAAAKAIVQSAARSADSPKAYYRSRPSQKTDDYLKTIKLGQTEVGSYIVKIIFPVVPDLQQALPTMENDVEISYDRKVTATLTTALNSLEEGIKQQLVNPSQQYFLDAIQQGVNANLCDALVSISNAIPEAAIDTSMTWARTRGKPTIKSKAHFQDDDFSYLQQASRTLREQAWGEEFTLVGNITKLSSADRLDGGEVTLRATVADKRRSVKLQLNPRQYQEALKIHKAYSDVEITGVIEQRGQTLVIENVKEITQLNDDA